MDLELNLDAEAIQDAVTQAILDSALGETIKTTVQNTLTGYQSREIWRKAIADEVKRVAILESRKVIEVHQDKIAEYVKEALSQETLKEITRRMIEQLFQD